MSTAKSNTVCAHCNRMLTAGCYTRTSTVWSDGPSMGQVVPLCDLCDRTVSAQEFWEAHSTVDWRGAQATLENVVTIAEALAAGARAFD
jgi:hypothetical protein